MAPPSSAKRIDVPPDFGGTLGFHEMKTTVISCGEPEVLVGRREDMSEHLGLLFKEFSGQPLISYYHAALIVRFRRGQDIGSDFLDLWRTEGDFLRQNLPLRWLVSACDSIIDDQSFPATERAVAFAATLVTATVKLYETERLAAGGAPLGRSGGLAEVQPLFDGMTTFSVGHGDMVKNLLERGQKVAGQTETAGPILMEILRRLHLNDTVFNRFLNAHVAPDTRWRA